MPENSLRPLYRTSCTRRQRRRILLLVFAIFPSLACAAVRIDLDVDATDVVHGIQHVHLLIPVGAGGLTLAYPKWIPGEHRPTGPITQLMNLHVQAHDAVVPWQRDVRDAYLFHLTLSSGTSAVDVRFDFFSPPKTFGPGFGETPDATENLIVLAFNQLILYPVGLSADEIEVKTRVRIPAAWQADCALPLARVGGGDITLPVVSLSTLVDSPLLAGRYFRGIALTGNATGTRVSVVADRQGDLAVDEQLVQGLNRLVPEATAVFGPGHYRRYVWLVALGNRLGHDGIEHHESSDVREAEALFTATPFAIDWRLFPHEYVHSWNGKYRRPDGLATPNYQQPMLDDLLWVYEGLTRYYGDFVLTARSRLATPEQTRAYLAYVAALMAHDRPGRNWRSIADTAIAYPDYGQAPSQWEAARRGSDFYGEMLLVWLEADALIRKQTLGARSLDDFCRSFFAGPERAPAMRSYRREDVIAALNRVVAFNWDAFFTRRVASVNPSPPLAAFEAVGWRVTYDDLPNDFLGALESTTDVSDLSLSLGLWVQRDGTIVDVVEGSPAFEAGMAPAMKLTALNGSEWTTEAARRALVQAENSGRPLEFEVAYDGETRKLIIDYHGGLRYPHLQRVAGAPDILGAILTSRAQPER
jgi:predicted metalloprotease with PDZ domain